jgi:hypothetical protein
MTSSNHAIPSTVPDFSFSFSPPARLALLYLAQTPRSSHLVFLSRLTLYHDAYNRV